MYTFFSIFVSIAGYLLRSLDLDDQPAQRTGYERKPVIERTAEQKRHLMGEVLP